MSRVADYTLKGFIYQFNKTLIEILNSANDTQIRVEGVIEDIDVIMPLTTEAIQCKYHECKKTFVLSDVYEPILQMLVNFALNPTANIKYVLHAYFEGETARIRNFTKAEIEDIFKTNNKDYIVSYISIIKKPLDITI